MKTCAFLCTLLSLSALAGCAGGDDTRGTRAPVVFGTDGRQDWFEAEDPAFADLLEEASVVLVDPTYIDVSSPDAVVPNTITLGAYKGLCDGERFAMQPAMGSCSGTLIDDDLVLTAAHCVDETVCADWYFVFDFVMEAPDRLRTMREDDLYRCAEILVWEYDGSDPWDDYAIVRLTRPVDEQRTPAPIEMSPRTLAAGDGLTVLGFGNGIPGKVHAGATVTEAERGWGYFIGSSDTFSGNSGSGTYNDAHRLIGVFARGVHEDYVLTGDGCQVVNSVPEAEASQDYEYAYKAVESLCATGHASARLCGTVPDADAGVDAGEDAGASRVSDAGIDPDAGVSEPPRGDGGCGCRVRGSSPPTLWLAAILGMLVMRRRGVRRRVRLPQPARGSRPPAGRTDPARTRCRSGRSCCGRSSC